jgi:spore coat polysaccharide biosynthesis predicted glycosyltransferase SpsG
MMKIPLNILFIPVSSSEGIGEYMRSLILADAIKQNWSNANICFILSKKAPYAKNCPFPSVLLESSPTKHVAEVNQIMTQFKPDLVIFDASGRQSQLKHAYNVGAKVIFISQHKRKRSRGLKLRRIAVTDKHWVAQPDFIIGPISSFERLKLKIMHKNEPTCLGSIFPKPHKKQQELLLQKYDLEKNNFLLFNAGSGGHKKDNLLCIDILAEAAKKIAAETTIIPVIVYGSNYPHDLPKIKGVKCIHSLDNKDFINLLAVSKAAIISGGDTLLQAITLHKPTLAIPVSKDQPARIAACKKNHLILDCSLNEKDIVKKTKKLMNNNVINTLMSNMQSMQQKNGLDICVNDIKELLGDR